MTSRPYIKIPVALCGILLVLGLGACQRPLTPEASCNFIQNKDVQRVSWNTKNPISLFIHESVPRDAYPSIEEAINVYARLFGREVFTIRGYGTSGPLEPVRDGYSVIYWLNTWESDRLREQGRTTVYWSGNTIYEADIRINASQASHLSFHYTQSGGNINGLDLKSLMVHELGHMLGLDHNDAQGSVMNTQLANGVARVSLSSQDQSNLHCEYE